MDYLKNVFGKKQIRFLIISAVSLLAAFAVLLTCVKLAGSLEAENMAKRWGDDRAFSQISVFLSELAEFGEDDVRKLAFSSEQQLKADSITANENARLMLYAYSSVGKVNISSANGEKSIKAIGVGGDFFLFHPVKLLYGSAFSDDSLNNDLVVIDTDTSYTLFGSYDVVGQVVEINRVPFVVSGVIERDNGRLNRLAGNNDPIVYVSHTALKNAGMHINMYETLMPSPVTGYAKKIISDGIGVDESYCEIVENTGRFYFTKLLKNVVNFGTRSMNSKGIVYPYWENMARGMEDYLTPLAALGLILFLIPAVCIVYIVFRMWKLRPIHKEDIKDSMERMVENSRERRKRKNVRKRNKKSKINDYVEVENRDEEE